MEPEELRNMKVCQFRSSVAGMLTMLAGGSITYYLLQQKSLKFVRLIPEKYNIPVVLGIGVGCGYYVTVSLMKACRKQQHLVRGQSRTTSSIVELREYMTNRIRPRSEGAPQASSTNSPTREIKDSVDSNVAQNSPPQAVSKYGDTGFFKAESK